MSSKRSRVHPKYKTKYRIANWPAYDKSLVERGDVTIWVSPEAVASWRPIPVGRRGAQPKFSDTAIETALTLRLVFGLPLRQAEGFLRSLLQLMALDLEAPDHTTLSRRGRHLDIQLLPRKSSGPIHLIVDSSGLAIFGEGEWAAAKHGGKGIRGWKKLHLGVDQAGVVVAQALTDGTADDAATVPELFPQIKGKLASFTADAAYDSTAIHNAATERGAKVVVPTTKTATRSRPRPTRCASRDQTVCRIHKVGRRQWKKESGYHKQARVENAFFRYKTILGDRLRSRIREGQEVEAVIACNILNQMTELGRPASYAIGR